MDLLSDRFQSLFSLKSMGLIDGQIDEILKIGFVKSNFIYGALNTTAEVEKKMLNRNNEENTSEFNNGTNEMQQLNSKLVK